MRDFIEVAVVEVSDDSTLPSAQEFEDIANAHADNADWLTSHVHNAPTGKRLGIMCRFDTAAKMKDTLEEALEQLQMTNDEVVWLHPSLDGMVARSFNL